MAIEITRENEESVDGTRDGVTGLRRVNFGGDCDAGIVAKCLYALQTQLASDGTNFQLGAAWDATVLPQLRVRRHNVWRERGDYCIGDIHYSTRNDHDIEILWDGAAVTVETSLNRALNPLGIIPGSDPEQPKTATRHSPAGTFALIRTECDAGYFDTIAGVETTVPWPGGAGRPTWGANSIAADSQRRKAFAMEGKLNSGFFLGDSTDTWMFVHATARLVPTGDMWTLPLWRVSYEFAYRPFRGQGWKWRDTWDADTLVDIEYNVVFQNDGGLFLRWPLGGGYLD